MNNITKQNLNSGEHTVDTSMLAPAEKQLVEVVSRTLIIHTKLEDVRAAIANVCAENEALSEKRHAILIGESGCGKTTFLEMITSDLLPREHVFQLGVQSQQAVVVLSLPSTITPRSMAVQVLRALGDQSGHNGTAQELTDRLIHYIRTCNVRMIFVDEFQHLLALGRGAPGPNQRLSEARNWIKSVIVATNVTFILMGMPETLALIDTESQLKRRFTHLLSLEPFSAPAAYDSELAVFADDLIDAAVQGLDLFDDAEMFTNRVEDAARLYAATQGVPSTIKDLVIRAALVAHRRNSRVITMGDFAHGYSLQRQARLDAEAARIRRMRRRNLAEALEGRALNPFAASIDELQPIILQMAA